MEDYKISVIIPVYNQQENIELCITSLQKQTVGFSRLEVIIINDGSTDRTDEICRSLVEKYESIHYFFQENEGVSSARNKGIKAASGKYIFYLDADDELANDTVEKVTRFFDSVYESVDLVTYKIDTLYNGRLLQPHFRYLYLKQSGIYDLNVYPYIGQTTMNIVVKNKFSENVCFDTKIKFSEDQKYCCEVLQSNLKMGFCSEGCYIYHRSSNSTSGRMAGACYIFEQCMKMFEELFDKYEDVPLAFQGLYINDIYWKLRENILFPHHYDLKNYNNAVKRICYLLERCDDGIILNHPNIDFFEKYYLLSLKRNNQIRTSISANAFALFDKNNQLVRETSMEIVVTRLTYKENTFILEGFLKSVFLNFYEDMPTLCAVENDGQLVRKMQLKDSSHNYYLSHEKTQSFLSFQYVVNIESIVKLRFEVELGGYWFPTHFYFMPLVALSHEKRYYSCRKNDIEIILDKHNNFVFKHKKCKKRKKIWLYYDCAGIDFDNGLLQFEHDTKKQDDVIRYYVITDRKQLKYLKNLKEQYIWFGSNKHKKLLKQSAKVITAFIEESNIIPYERKEYDAFARKFNAEVIYLQHGVLHIIMPWKYSREKLLADRVVVSTQEEAELYKLNGYGDEFLIKTGMPRFEISSKSSNKKKILFAPSWRKYLVGDYVEHKWQPLEEKFLVSRFYLEINDFLHSVELNQLLRQTGYRLELKLHPIFEMYKKYFVLDQEYISFAEEKVNDGDYELFITDFSSYAFNFSFLSIPVIHFIPDIEEFKCGMNGYRELNYPDNFWNMVVSDYPALVKNITEFCTGQDVKQPSIHFFRCRNIRESIYQEILKKDKGDRDE